MSKRKFKVGDKVVIKKESVYGPKGVVGTVVDYNNTKYTVEFENGFSHWFKGIELDAYTEPKKVEKPVKAKKVDKKPKFKVGDIVKGISDKYVITNHDMTKGEVTKCNETSFWVKVLEHPNKRYIGVEFPVRYEHFEKITEKEEPKNTIVIYQRDRDVVALDKVTGQKCYAHCHPDDAFDFKTGAKIAFTRLIGEPVGAEPIKEEVVKEEPIKYLDKFERDKEYIFDLKTFMSRYPGEKPSGWEYECEGKVVNVTSPKHGVIGMWSIDPSWCKEVTPKEKPKTKPTTFAEFLDMMLDLLTEDEKVD